MTQKCAKNLDYFIFNHCYTLDEHDETSPIKLFPRKQYLEELIKIEQDPSNEQIAYWKSRQMMITWLNAMKLLHGALFRDGYKGFIQSEDEEKASGVIERIFVAYQHLPAELKENTGECLDRKCSSGRIKLLWPFPRISEIRGLTGEPDQVLSSTVSDFFSDETEFQPDAARSYSNLRPALSGGGMWRGVSTPNGKRFLYELAHATPVVEGLEGYDHHPIGNIVVYGKKIMEGLIVSKKTNDITTVYLHYTADPDKNPKTEKGKKWYDKERKGYSDAEWKRQYELDFATWGGKPVFPEFDRNIHVATTQYNPERNIIRGWDFGNHSVCVFFQKNKLGQWQCLAEYITERKSTAQFADEVKDFTLEWFGECSVKDYAGHEALQMNRHTRTTDAKILNSKGIYPSCRKHDRRSKMENIRRLLRIRDDGLPGLINDPRCVRVNEAMSGGYIFDENLEGKVSELPKEDGYFEHPMDAYGYALYQVAPIESETVKNTEQPRVYIPDVAKLGIRGNNAFRIIRS